MLENLITNANLIIPEIIVSVTLLLIVLFDLIFQKDKTIIPYISATGFLLALFFTIRELNVNSYAFATSATSNRYGLIAIDSFGSYFKIIVLITSVLIIFFSKTSSEIKRIQDRSGEFYTLITGMVLGMLFMVSAADLIMIYLSIELLSLSSYVLAGFTKLKTRNSEASLKYLIYGAVSSGLMLFGISLLYGMSGNTGLIFINTFLRNSSVNILTYSFSLILIFVGIGFKLSAVPFHFWTPDVYEGAPISITAFLSVASKAAGFAVLIRLLKTTFILDISDTGAWNLINFFDWRTFLIVISILTMTLGNFVALWQNNLKRMLAYSSIAHAGYMLLAVATLSNQGILATMIHFLVYMLMNIGAFYIVMLIANKTGSEDINDYNRLGYASPFLGVALSIFLISLTGLPPLAGFISKLYIFLAVIDAKLITVAVIAVINSVVSLYYYIRVLKHMFLSKAKTEPEHLKLSLNEIIFILILLIPTLLFGLYFTPMVEFAKSSLSILGY